VRAEPANDLNAPFASSQLPFVQALIVNTTLESGERGIGIILDAAGGGGGGGSQNPNKDPSRSHEFPEVMKGTQPDGVWRWLIMRD